VYTSQYSLVAVGGANPHGCGVPTVAGQRTVGLIPGMVPGLDLLGSLFGGGDEEPEVPHAGAPGKALKRLGAASASLTPTTYTPTAAPAKAMTAMEFAVAKQVAQRELNALVSQLQRQWPEATGMTLYRHTSSGGSGKNYTSPISQGVWPVLHHTKNPNDWMLKEYSRAVVRPGTKAIVWQNLNFSGPTMELKPGDHNLSNYGWNDRKGPKSGVILPDVNFDGIINQIAQKIVDLASPANGCVIDASSFQGGQVNHPAMAALMAFLDKVIVLVQGSPLAQKYQTLRATLPAQVAAGVLSNMEACKRAQAGAPAAAPAQVSPAPVTTIRPPALPTFGPFWFGIAGQAVGPNDRAATVKKIGAGQVTRQTWAWKQGMASWKAAGDVVELKPLFGAQPPSLPTAQTCSTRLWKGVCLPASLAGCEDQGGFLQGKVNTSTGRIRRDTIRCTMPQASRQTLRAAVQGRRPFGVAGRKRRRRLVRGIPALPQQRSPLFSQRPLSVIEAEWQARQGGGMVPGAAQPSAMPMDCPPCEVCQPPVWPTVMAESDPDQALTELRDNLGNFRKQARTFQRDFKKHMKSELGKPFINQMSVALKNLTKSAGETRKLARDFLSGDWSPPETGQAALLKALGVGNPGMVFGHGTMPAGRYVC